MMTMHELSLELTVTAKILCLSNSFLIVANTAKYPRQSSLKFLLLNPKRHFEAITREARAVVLTGGTMQPMSDYICQLLNPSEHRKVHLFSCGHVIPARNLLALSLRSGPSAQPFEFTFQKRYQPELIEDLGMTIVNLASVVPDGIVLFFPSYEYEDYVFSHWERRGLIRNIETKKKYIREPRNATNVEDTFHSYQQLIESNYSKKNVQKTIRFRGAILSCVAGGKLSEGINFNDGLGRCIVMLSFR